MNRFPPSERLTSIIMPPISVIMKRITELRSAGRRVHSMAQAVPWYTPPPNALEKLSGFLADPAAHRYSPDPGYLSTRIAVADDLRIRRSIHLDPETELHLTCGASQAFLSALLTAASAGSRVAVLEPYYFDHVFAIRFSDLELVSIPLIENEDSWSIPVERLRNVMSELSVLVIVNPGNPTGTVIPDPVMKEIVELTERSGTFLIIDETYERFVFTGDHWHPWMDAKTDHVLTLGSFSKSLGMPGWRLGYLFGDARLLRHAIKVQDSVVICPPSPAQILLEHALLEKEWIEEKTRGVKRRLDLCRKTLSSNSCLRWMDTGGAFFTLAGYRENVSSQDAAAYILEEYGIGLIPGSAFGPAGEGHLRISFGCLEENQLEHAMSVLAEITLPESP